jgi:dihydroorotate dehydrogenase (fumarate)
VSAVKGAVQIPIAVKLSPYFTSFVNLARKFVQQGGADALVLFNQFYQPDIDPERLEIVPNVVLTIPTLTRLPLRAG